MKCNRIFVEKNPQFRIEAASLLSEFNENLSLKLGSLRLINVYDLFGFSDELIEKCRYTVFGETVTDTVTDDIDLPIHSSVGMICSTIASIRPASSSVKKRQSEDLPWKEHCGNISRPVVPTAIDFRNFLLDISFPAIISVFNYRICQKCLS